MPTQITLAPVGAGKTAITLDRLSHTLDRTPFAKVWVLLASKRQEHAFRQRLVEMGHEVYFNVEFFNFYQLYQRLLDMQGKPQRDLSDTARYSILRSVIQQLNHAGQLKVFHTIADTPGFVRIVADFIYELKQNRVESDKFAAVAAQTDNRKDDNLALIYREYQDRLQRHNLVDIEGEGWLAVNALRDERDLAGDLALLIVDGFDQFTTVQADLLTLLADRAGETLITLTTVPGDDRTTVNRRFQRALDVLTERFADGTYEVNTLEAGHGARRHPHLQHLVAHVFRRDAIPQPPDDDPRVTMIESPDTGGEVGAVLRRVKRLLLEGTSPEEILVALRDWGRYYTHFLTYKQVYGLPLVLHYGEPLLENPAVAALMHLLTLAERDFRHGDLVDALHSRYFDVQGLTDESISLIEQVGRKYQVVVGREAWLDAIMRANAPDVHDDDATEPLIPDVDQAENLRLDLETFFDNVTPPEIATVEEYVTWIERLIGCDPVIDLLDKDDDDLLYEIEQGGFTLDMIERIRDHNAPDRIVARDLIALHTFKWVLWSLISAQDLLESLDNKRDGDVTWERFLTDLTTALNNAAMNARPNRSGQVLVTTAADARGLPHDHVFILGLSEGVFPAQIPEDPLYHDSERNTLNELGIPLMTQAERAGDDSLFYELICLPRQSLTLSRPTVQEGKLWIESHLWRVVEAVAKVETHTLRIGEVVPPDWVASHEEAALAVAGGLAGHDDATKGVYNWLHESPYWTHIHTGREIEAARMSRQVRHNRYSGKLDDEALIAHIAHEMRPDKPWSASRLNDYGVCGFRYFAKRLLKLESLEEPETGMDAAQHGTINHAILEETYRAFQDEVITITPENYDRARMIFDTVAGRVLDEAPDKHEFRPDVTWEQEKSVIRNKLSVFLARDFSEDPRENPIRKAFTVTSRRPYRLEARFGNTPRIAMPLPNGETMHLSGVIDRVDLIAPGKAIVIDYKSGSTTINTPEMTEGRNFQMMVYLLAAQQLFPEVEIVGGAFWHLSNYTLSGVIHLDSEGLESIEQARRHIDRYLALGRSGDFAVHANKPAGGKCVRYCEFHHLCRMSSTHQRKID